MRLVPGTCSAVRAPSTRSCRWNGTVPGSSDTFDSTPYLEGKTPVYEAALASVYVSH